MGDGCKLTKQAYRDLIEEDIAWLERQPRSLERDHIIVTLRWSVDALYETNENTAG